LNTLTSPSSYNRQGGQLRQTGGRYTTHSNANTYHAQSWGGYGGRSNSAGGSRGGSAPSGGHSSGGSRGGGGHGGRH
jgi:hypothetical protein